MNIPIRDIKPNVEMVDWSYIGFILLLVAVGILILFLIFKFLKRDKNRKILKNMDLEDSKFVAYNFEKLAKKYENELYRSIVERLKDYKYVPKKPLDEELKRDIKRFIDAI